MKQDFLNLVLLTHEHMEKVGRVADLVLEDQGALVSWARRCLLFHRCPQCSVFDLALQVCYLVRIVGCLFLLLAIDLKKGIASLIVSSR